jgi:hypothetical protein
MSLGSQDECELIAKPVWRVKLVTELQAGETTEVEVARIERDVRTAVLNDTLEDTFRRRYPGFRPTNDNEAVALIS